MIDCVEHFFMSSKINPVYFLALPLSYVDVNTPRTVFIIDKPDRKPYWV